MDWNSIVLTTVGAIAGITSVIHGILMHRLIIKPIEAIFVASGRITAPLQKLVTLLLHFTTFNWLLSGLALIAAVIWFDQDVQLAVGLLAGSSYLYGAIITHWAIRKPHPGGILMLVASILIVLGLTVR